MTKGRKDHSGATYKIGYGRPPVATRFVKGKSGNPNGKPKRAKQQAPVKSHTELLYEIGQRPIRIMQNGQESTVSMWEAVIIKFYQSALAGKLDAIRLLIKQSTSVDDMLARRPEIPDDETLGKMTSDEIEKTYHRLFGRRKSF